METILSGRTDVGIKRGHNEDCFGIFPELGLAVVADGMGGHAAGELASRIAVDTLSGFIAHTAGKEDITWPFGLDGSLSRGANRLVAGIRLANSAVLERAASSPELKGMGTTIAAALMEDDRIHIAHVGDSRAYLLSGGAFSRLTADHSFVEEQVQAGVLSAERARTHPMKNIITRALGIRSDVSVDIATRTPSHGDIFLLCTDGLSGMLDDSEAGRIVLDNSADLDRASDALIDAANVRGGDDNITVVLVKIL